MSKVAGSLLTVILSVCIPAVALAQASTTSPGSGVDGGQFITGIADAEQAIHLIETTGTFATVDGQASTDSGAGTGFVISPDGLMVTNNHVVAGASIIEVTLPGRDFPVNAPVLGYSECHDLAVLDLPLDDLPFLAWRDAPVVAGENIIAAGYPDGDPRFALIRGNVVRAPGPGATAWSSIDLEIEHTAPARPGSSGGPLLDEAGSVVGIHYAGSGDGLQHWAIAATEAREVVEQLAAGEDVASIGLNGEAMEATEDLPAGIFVASVVPGSVADVAGIIAGDLVTSLNGIALAEDGSMGAYCSVLRSHGPDDTLSVEVARPSTGELLAGQLNGSTLVATSGPGPTAGDITDAELALREHVPPGILDSGTCVTSDEGDFPQEAIASIECVPPTVAIHIWYDRFETAAAMNASYRALWKGKVSKASGRCPAGVGERGWLLNQSPNGRVACWVTDGRAWMTWSDDDLLIVTTASQEPAAWGKFKDWWATEAGPFR